MPPKRCPECGRFLANDLVTSLTDAPAPCPRCGIELRPETIIGGERARRPRPSAPTAAAAAAVPSTDAAGSIRPPDLDPQAVQTRDEDVLAGWDVGADAEEVASWRRDQRPFPTDTVIVVGASVGAGLLGALLADEHPVRWTAVGALGGALGAGAARRIWELRG
ncbi:MAG: hypothetical protein ACNA8R_11230 [Nitriliruptoraceae bacterium]